MKETLVLDMYALKWIPEKRRLVLSCKDNPETTALFKNQKSIVVSNKRTGNEVEFVPNTILCIEFDHIDRLIKWRYVVSPEFEVNHQQLIDLQLIIEINMES